MRQSCEELWAGLALPAAPSMDGCSLWDSDKWCHHSHSHIAMATRSAFQGGKARSQVPGRHLLLDRVLL